MFELINEINFILFYHIIDFYTDDIIVTNNFSNIVKVSKNFCLKVIIEMLYDDCFQITWNEMHEAITTSKNNRLKNVKATAAMFVSLSKTTSSIEMSITTCQFESQQKVKLFNEIITYENCDSIEAYTQLIHEFGAFWHDEEFIDVFKDQWMNFSL